MGGGGGVSLKKGGGDEEEEEKEDGHSRVKSNCSYRALFEDVIGQGNAVTCGKGLRDFTVY